MCGRWPTGTSARARYLRGRCRRAMLRERRQAHQAVGEQPVEARNADEEALIQAPSPTRSLTRKRDAVPDTAHDLHVLLRHRLLRKPGGFEAIGAARVLLDAADLAALDGDDLSDLH